MRKIFAFLLVLAMLIPMGTVANAAESADKPFYAVQMSAYESELSNMYPMAFFWANSAKLDDPLGFVSYGGSYEIADIAATLKKTFDAYPDGTRFLNFGPMQTVFRNKKVDVIFVEDAVAFMKEWMHAFITEYSRIGGKLDGIATGVQFEDEYANSIESRYYSKDNLVYDKIVKNPAYQEKIRPQLEERGFKFYPNPTEYTPEIYGIHSASGSEYAQCRSIWDAIMRSYINQSITEACKEVWEYYPHCQVSDYQASDVKPWVKGVNENGGAKGGGGIQYAAGNSSNDNFYCARPFKFFENGVYRKILGYTGAVYEDKTYNHFQFDVNSAKSLYLSADDGKISMWIADYLSSRNTPNSACMTPYYAETIFHLYMLDPVAVMSFITPTDVGDQGLYESVLQILNECLAELTRVAGKADREPIQVQANWNNHYMLSGLRVDDKNIWRLTPDTDLVSVENFKTDAADPTFTVNGQTITFPQGKIIPDGNIRGMDADYNTLDNHTCGYWIETPAGVNPVATRAEGYFAAYPSYEENYDSYDAGMEYNYKNALPAACWEVKKSGKSSATIVANGEDRALALQGTYTLKNVNLPKNITAADSYAENQAWQVSVTLPADMGAESEMILLNAVNEKKKSADGGFKIAGGKVYYSQNGEYAELTDVALTAGAEYIFKREMNFSSADQLACSYYVCDSTGALLGKAENVSVAPVELPVYGIEVSCSKVDGEAVLLDDYKLYPVHVNSDFELYKAKTGIKVTDLETPVAENMAYRYSWLNATDKEKSYSVIAQYYNGDAVASEEVIREVKMAPNSEGVEFGIVELGDKGISVKIFIKDNNPSDTQNGAADDGNADAGNASAPDMTLAVIIAAAAVLVITAVVVIILLTRKRASKKESKDAENKSE